MSKQQIVEIEEGEHLLIKTPHGEIQVFVGAHHRSINAYVHDVWFTGVYTETTEKKSLKKAKSYFGGWRRIVSLKTRWD